MTRDAQTPVSHAARVVLVVDDDPLSQAYFAEVLAELGVGTVQSASDGRAGLRALAELSSPPDLLICDVFMPDMDGIEFLDELSQKGYPAGVMLVSGQNVSMLSVAQKLALAKGLKIWGAYTKPVAMAVLGDVLLHAASG